MAVFSRKPIQILNTEVIKLKRFELEKFDCTVLLFIYDDQTTTNAPQNSLDRFGLLCTHNYFITSERDLFLSST